MTAAVALSGTLGQRYPLEATRWLWHLIRRSVRIRSVTVIALANLLAAMADTGEGPGPVLRFVATKLRKLMESDDDPAGRRVALDAVVFLLGYRPPAQDPVVTRVLRNHPGECARLGRLWAPAINSRPHRRPAVEALRTSLEVLDRREGGTDAAYHLGAAILPRIGGDALIAVEVSLRGVLNESRLSAGILASFFFVLTASSAPDHESRGTDDSSHSEKRDS